MIKHIVLWKMKDEAFGNNKEKNAEIAKEKLESLNDVIKDMIRLDVHIPINEMAREYDLCLYSEFNNIDDYNAYEANETHLSVMKEIGEMFCGVTLFNYEEDK